MLPPAIIMLHCKMHENSRNTHLFALFLAAARKNSEKHAQEAREPNELTKNNCHIINGQARLKSSRLMTNLMLSQK